MDNVASSEQILEEGGKLLKNSQFLTPPRRSLVEGGLSDRFFKHKFGSLPLGDQCDQVSSKSDL